ncbi:4-alpha-glucanotransferase [Acuticoccus sp. M5D2P5]|uniref:4-alpha-glucanotransferase n=1 Tax=Acuticoccus kalidii TaxID=2910977 RepID=UPI001F26DFBD|nr:4-alpha-glucanotransferase [Acuticoccus kalidii]MCF3936582.1 4-alpha-glucanotransferase [Acuticoccus kalidii]
MTESALDRAARAAGIILDRPGEHAPPVPDFTKHALTEMLGPAPAPPPSDERPAFVPHWLDATRTFGIALQLYQLRSARNLGVGDLADLMALLPCFAEAGADFVGLNPLHALFTADPERASPFSPSDRRFLNPLIIAVELVPGYRPQMRDAVTVPTADTVVDYTGATAAKLAILKAIHRRWRAGEADISDAARAAAASHAEDGGETLADFALFEALSHAMRAEGRTAGWLEWPEPFRDRSSDTVHAFAAAHAEEVDFHRWLQFLADDQLRTTQEAALAAGMRVGLYLDLAVGTAPDGAATWSDPSLTMRGVRVGAPPDLFSLDGQDWGLAPFSPTELIARNFAPYRAVMSAVMRHAGAVRIDHAMGLERLFLIPDGAIAADGAYVRQPGLTDQVVDATHLHRAIAIGEDLGVVPPGFRERMAKRRIFSTRILSFERGPAGMIAPSRYPKDSLACISTHDMAPLAAWWLGDEIGLRLDLGRIDDAVARHERAWRHGEKQAILALAGLPPRRAEDPLDDDIVVAVHRVAARTASRLLAVRLEDVVGGRRLVNLPGTDREHPNWRHTLPLDVEAIARSERLARTLRAVHRERGP